MLALQAICSANVIILYYFLMVELFTKISGSTGLIFTNFSSYDRYLIVDQRSDSLFLIAKGTMPWQAILDFQFQKVHLH